MNAYCVVQMRPGWAAWMFVRRNEEMERGTLNSNETDMALTNVRGMLSQISKRKGHKVAKFLEGVNQLCRTLEIIAQINECKASSHKLQLKPFGQLLLKEYERKIQEELSGRYEKVFVTQVKNYVYAKIRLATRMCQSCISYRPKNLFPLIVEC